MPRQNQVAVGLRLAQGGEDVGHVVLILPDVGHVTRLATRLAVAAQVERNHAGAADVAKLLGALVEGGAVGRDAVQQQNGVVGLGRELACDQRFSVTSGEGERRGVGLGRGGRGEWSAREAGRGQENQHQRNGEIEADQHGEQDQADA